MFPLALLQEVKEAEPVAEEAAATEAEPAGEVVPENGNAAAESVENGNDNGAEAVAEGDDVTGEKRKSVEVAGGEGDGPDSTEVVAKKAKVDDEEAVVEPTVEATA